MLLEVIKATNTYVMEHESEFIEKRRKRAWNCTYMRRKYEREKVEREASHHIFD